uniref:3-oxoacyl-[acyl-carrier-protein] reductase FabG n=1 Tax=Talaromyces marneffei PM1 TaxID=1077442 RepID=A0A093VM21_TALMA
MEDLTLDGKVAIITGSSRGIGEGLAVEFARRGAKVVVTYTSESSSAKADNILSRLADYKYGRSAITVQADLRTMDGPSQVIAATIKAFPDEGISILVNNAGCEVQKRLSEATVEDLAPHHQYRQCRCTSGVSWLFSLCLHQLRQSRSGRYGHDLSNQPGNCRSTKEIHPG